MTSNYTPDDDAKSDVKKHQAVKKCNCNVDG
jgi:hypothetical protein